jgi:choline dehydrogenase-like flavoprotein
VIGDARSVPADERLQADLCIVGAGPAGLTLALQLAATGAKILLLESGSARWSWRAKDLARGESVNAHYYRLEWTRVRTFGGSSWAWRKHGLRTRPLESLDFLPRPEIGRPGWPLDYAELEPYWGPASELCQLGPVGYDTAQWEDRHRAILSTDPDLETAMFPVGPGDAFTRLSDQVRRLPEVTCLLHATVLELVTDQSGRRVERAWVTSGSGRGFTVEARWFVLGMGGIENARLLLLSRRTHTRGLGNFHGLVGRYFMEHPHVRTGVLRIAPRRPWPDTQLYRGVERSGVRGIGFLRLADAALRREALPGSAWALHPTTEELVSDAGRSLADLKDTVRSYWRATPATKRQVVTAASHPVGVVRAMAASQSIRRRQVAAPLYRLLGMMEQKPDPNSRVVLGSRRDRYGQPVARLDWRLTEEERRSIRKTQDVLSAALERAGVGVIEQRYGEVDPAPLIGGGFHHLGTTRMHPDPLQGVVDTDGRVHGVANLFVAGSSVFPTAGFANPTLTLVALTLRLARHIARRELNAG